MNLQHLRNVCIALWLVAASVKQSGFKSTLQMLFPYSISSSLGGKARRYTAQDDDHFKSTLKNKYGITEAFDK